MADFSHVQTILKMAKPCGLSLTEVVRKFDDDGRCDFTFSVRVPLDSGSHMLLQLRWIIRCRSQDQTCWASALLLDNWPIDRIDHERRFMSLEGIMTQGWHRHIWDAVAASCESRKEILGGFGNFATKRNFVRDVSNIFGLEFRREGDEEHGTTSLLFGEGIDD